MVSSKDWRNYKSGDSPAAWDITRKILHGLSSFGDGMFTTTDIERLIAQGLEEAQEGLTEEDDDFEPDYVGEAREEAANDPSPGWTADSEACRNEP